MLVGDGYIALELPDAAGDAAGDGKVPLMANAASDKTEYVVCMPPLTFLRHLHTVFSCSLLAEPYVLIMKHGLEARKVMHKTYTHAV